MAPPSKKVKVGHTDAESASTAANGSNEEDISGQRTVFVRSLPYSATTESLSAHFSYIAPLKHATVVIDPATKSSRGFGFVTFTDPADAAKAVKEFHGKLFDGRHIKVEIAQARHRDGDKKKQQETVVVDGEEEGTTKKKSKLVQRAVGKKEEEEVKKRNPRLIVRNLPWSVKNPEQLKKYFEKFGTVKEVIIPRKDNKKFGPMSGFGFVTMKKQKSAAEAIEAVNGTEIEGRTVAVDWAIEKNEWTQQAANGEDTEGEQSEKEDGMDIDDDKDSVDEDLENDNDDDSDDSSDANSDSDMDLDNEDEEDDEDEEEEPKQLTTNETTIFIRNLNFTTDEDALYEHFTEHFGPIRYARTVLEPETGRPRGTAFVCFYNVDDYESCLASAPTNTIQTISTSSTTNSKSKKDDSLSRPSLLQNDALDPTGKYTLDNRILSISRAVSKDEANRLTTIGVEKRKHKSDDKRRLFLLNEGRITSTNPMYQKLSQADIKMRDESLNKRRKFLDANPTLHLSLTRLAVMNIPRNVGDKELKMLARKAIVEFATEVKQGRRERISKEESSRGGEEAKELEERRKKQGKGVVRQAKIQMEKEGGRSKGTGFLEFTSHRHALMGLRWLNGREVAQIVAEDKKKEGGEKNILDVDRAEKKRRLVVEFALENVQVIQRRAEREKAARERKTKGSEGGEEGGKRGWKRKRGGEKETVVINGKKDQPTYRGKQKGDNPEKDDKVARAARIIARKRAKRRNRK